MSAGGVNLDAMIPRENFDVEAEQVHLNRDTTVSITTLRDKFFSGSLRKPDFQRETSHWTPQQVVDLIRSFLDADLIPAVILWQSGPYIFVIDGAHRLSAIYAWINDDYGDKSTSQIYFDHHVPEDQIRIADRTRNLVAKEVGTFDTYLAAQERRAEDLSPLMRARLAKVRTHSFTAQWVLSNDPKVAEASFFKINQAASPLDPTETRILRARDSANALAARAITRAGGGHRYWRQFRPEIRKSIEDQGRLLYKALYEPPMDEGYVKSLDVPVAGRGYNALPFVFDLVNLANDQKISDSTAKRPIKEDLPADPDGDRTLTYMRTVGKLVGRITGHHPGALGLHPLVYFYSRTGTFQPVAFFATAKLLEDLESTDRLIAFTRIRASFEAYLIEHREGVSILVNRLGSGSRSLTRMQLYFERVLSGLWAGATIEQIRDGFAGEKEWEFLTQSRGLVVDHNSPTVGGKFSRNTKSAAVIQGIVNVRRCSICGGFIHRNSMHIDHRVPARDGGLADLSNAQVTHPYCDSAKDHLAGITVPDRAPAVMSGT